MDERLFTLAEASQMLSRLRLILVDAGIEWRRMRDLNPEIQKVRDKVSMDGFSPYGVEYIESVTHLMILLHQVKDLGVVVKDVDKGLCDFPYMRNGCVVYLCWHLGEDSIAFWHDIESGFVGRESLDQ